MQSSPKSLSKTNFSSNDQRMTHHVWHITSDRDVCNFFYTLLSFIITVSIIDLFDHKTLIIAMLSALKRLPALQHVQPVAVTAIVRFLSDEPVRKEWKTELGKSVCWSASVWVANGCVFNGNGAVCLRRTWIHANNALLTQVIRWPSPSAPIA